MEKVWRNGFGISIFAPALRETGAWVRGIGAGFSEEGSEKRAEKFGGGKKVFTFAAPNRRVRREKRRVGSRRERRGDIQMFFDTLAPMKRKRNRK